jgi:hypothetical protein
MATELKEDVLYCLEQGIVYCAVCAPASWDADKVKEETNAKGRPGTSANEWVISEPTAEQATPVTCPEDPNRKHWLLNC